MASLEITVLTELWNYFSETCLNLFHAFDE